MNYVDTIDVSGVNTPPANSEQPSAQTLNEEVNEVIGQLNSFWGGFRKQASLVIVRDHGRLVMLHPAALEPDGLSKCEEGPWAGRPASPEGAHQVDCGAFWIALLLDHRRSST